MEHSGYVGLASTKVNIFLKWTSPEPKYWLNTQAEPKIMMDTYATQAVQVEIADKNREMKGGYIYCILVHIIALCHYVACNIFDAVWMAYQSPITGRSCFLEGCHPKHPKSTLLRVPDLEHFWSFLYLGCQKPWFSLTFPLYWPIFQDYNHATFALGTVPRCRCGTWRWPYPRALAEKCHSSNGQSTSIIGWWLTKVRNFEKMVVSKILVFFDISRPLSLYIYIFGISWGYCPKRWPSATL